MGTLSFKRILFREHADVQESIRNMETTEHELDLLEYIAHRSESVHQRDLARVSGLSLGMTNVIVKRLAQKGWLTIRKVNNRNIRYAVSPSGIKQITRRSYRYFMRTVRNVVHYREAIEDFARDIKSRGYQGLLLIGRSDLDFIVEHACGISGLEYVQEEQKTGISIDEGGIFALYSEIHIPDGEAKHNRSSAAFLREVVSGVNEERWHHSQ
jgi:DNA-binding MarR family transcriptional regulator